MEIEQLQYPILKHQLPISMHTKVVTMEQIENIPFLLLYQKYHQDETEALLQSDQHQDPCLVYHEMCWGKVCTGQSRQYTVPNSSRRCQHLPLPLALEQTALEHTHLIQQRGHCLILQSNILDRSSIVCLFVCLSFWFFLITIVD